jgi:nicotinamidase-related amidase
MHRSKRLSPEHTLLLVIDVQERLAPAMDAELRQRLVANLVRLGEAKKALRFGAILSEQYPDGLGRTLPEVAAAFEGVSPRAKVCFAATEDAVIGPTVLAPRPSCVVVAGMETHICVFQTVRDLRARGLDVVVLADAVASRTRDNFELGLSLARECGAVISSTETVLFDLLGRAGTPEFKAISRLVR